MIGYRFGGGFAAGSSVASLKAALARHLALRLEARGFFTVLEGDEGLHRPVGVGRVGEAEVRQPVHEGADRLRRRPGPGRGASERYFDCLASVARCLSRSASARSARRRAPSLSRVACTLRSIAS